MLHTRTNRRHRTPGFLFTAIVAALPAMLAVASSAAATAHQASHVRLAQTTNLPPPPPPFGNNAQPADTNDDSVISPVELTTYATEFLTGMTPPQGPSPITPLLITNAATIFLTASGVYHFDSTANPPYVPGPASTTRARSVTGSSTRLARNGSMPLGTAAATCPTRFRPGAAFTVTLTITPAAAVHAYAIADTAPAGWSVSAVSDGGVFDASSHTVRWFFLDHTVRTVHYRIVPSGSFSTAVFHGEAAFDGVSRSIGGVRSLTAQAGSRGGAQA